MATRAGNRAFTRGDDGFFLVMALVMAAILVSGFSLQWVMGRSTFHAPLLIHIHAVIFFGWTMLYVLQNGLIASGSVALHRRLGWAATLWVPLMIVVGITATVAMLQRGSAPFFFTPLGFLLMNGLSILTFGALMAAGIAMRRRTQWHRRLIYCGMALLTGPGLGRLLPMPFLIPWAEQVIFAAVMIFPLIGIIADLRRTGTVHPAWWVGSGAIIALEVMSRLLVHSAFGLTLYGLATAGTPGAAIAPLAYPAMPPL